ncbi:hypothetical protein [Halorussus ruber]|nr:hypothetical protein [Halorussus ruber]
MSDSERARSNQDPSEELPPEETELWEAIQESKDDEFVRPEQEFEF